MSLEDTIKELKAEIELAEKREGGEEIVEETEETEEVAEEEKTEETKAETKEEAKAEPKVEEKKEEELDSAGYARLRREAAAERKKREELEREVEALKAKKEEPVEEVERIELPPEVNELIETQRKAKAFQEFQELEAPFRAKTPEYDDIAEQFLVQQAHSIKIQNPRLPNEKVFELAKETILRKAGKYLNDGFNPIEELYHEALELGLKPRAKAEEKAEEVKEEPKPDMKKVAANRQRSAGMNGASGKQEGQLTKQAAGELSIAEWQKLPASEKRRLMYG